MQADWILRTIFINCKHFWNATDQKIHNCFRPTNNRTITKVNGNQINIYTWNDRWTITDNFLEKKIAMFIAIKTYKRSNTCSPYYHCVMPVITRSEKLRALQVTFTGSNARIYNILFPSSACRRRGMCTQYIIYIYIYFYFYFHSPWRCRQRIMAPITASIYKFIIMEIFNY